MTKNNKKGFSLVELLVAMAIIAVLIAIAAFGIQILQRNSRNTQRRKVVQDLVLAYNDIIANQNQIPTQFVFGQGDGNDIGLGDGTSTLTTTAVPVSASFSSVTEAGSGDCDALADETSTSAMTLCIDAADRQVGVQIEGSPTAFVLEF